MFARLRLRRRRRTVAFAAPKSQPTDRPTATVAAAGDLPGRKEEERERRRKWLTTQARSPMASPVTPPFVPGTATAKAGMGLDESMVRALQAADSAAAKDGAPCHSKAWDVGEPYAAAPP